MISGKCPKRFRAASIAAATLAMALGTMPLAAQTVEDDEPVGSQQLDLPKNVQLLGQSDPHLRKATAVVNGDIITGTDIDQRLALVVAANGGKISPEEKERLRVQVLRNLIDETLQIQEAAANDIRVGKEELNENYARVASNFRRTPAQFDAYLRSEEHTSELQSH